jgi:transcriptional regulator with XRE-family HTH domain
MCVLAKYNNLVIFTSRKQPVNHQQFKAGRKQARLTQVEAAKRLGTSQPYLSQLEKGLHPVTRELARRATKVYDLSPTHLPVPKAFSLSELFDSAKLARQLAGLGYPGFAHLRAERTNPAALMLQALVQPDLEVRLTEALPWVLCTYPDLGWPWLADQVKLKDAQNRLGFLVGVAKGVTESKHGTALELLSAAEATLEHSRLAREDTLCRDSMPDAERRWLKINRSPLAQHWNLLTGMTAEQLSYGA